MKNIPVFELLKKDIRRTISIDTIAEGITEILQQAFQGRRGVEGLVLPRENRQSGLMYQLGLLEEPEPPFVSYHFTPQAEQLYRQLRKEGYYRRRA